MENFFFCAMKRYVGGTITKRKKNAANNKLFANMNSHHQNIKFIVETNPIRFPDTAFNVISGSVITKIFQKPGKFPAFGTSKYQNGSIEII